MEGACISPRHRAPQQCTGKRGQDGPWALLGTSPPLRPPHWLRSDTKAILSVLISSALHVFREQGQLCGRLTEFQEVDVFLGFESSLFALDEVATRESPFASPLSWHWPQLVETWPGVSPHTHWPSPVQPPHLSLGPGLARSPPGKGTALGHSVGEGGSLEKSQDQREQALKALLLAGRMEVTWEGGNGSGKRHHAACQNHSMALMEPRTRGESRGTRGSQSECHLYHACLPAEQAEEGEACLSRGAPAHETKPHLLVLLPQIRERE